MAGTAQVTTLFDRWALTYDRADLQLLAYRPLHDAVLGRVRGSSPSVVLDVGCGTGQLTGRLRRTFEGAVVVGVDLSDGMLAAAADRAAAKGRSTPILVRADSQRLPFPASSVDLIVCTESFHWYREQSQVLDEWAAALRPGGRLLIASIATLTAAGDRLLRRASGIRGAEIRALPPGRLRTLLHRSGFEVTHQRRIPRLGPAAWPVLTDARRL